MKGSKFFAALLTGLFLSAPAFPASGPLQVKNQFPLFIHSIQPYMKKALPESSLSLGISHSNVFTVQNSGEWVVDMDMEITELHVRYRHVNAIIGEVGIDLPFIAFGHGFLDGFLEFYHELIGIPDPYGRSSRPANSFLYEIRHGDFNDLLSERGTGATGSTAVVAGETGIGISDIRLTLKRPLAYSDTSLLSISGALELPTGDANKGYGNGSTDAAVSLLYDRRLSKRVMSYWNAGVLFPGTLRAHKDIELQRSLYGGASLEWDFRKKWSALLQLQGQSSVYPETDLKAIDMTAYLLAFGGRYHGEHHCIEFSITEDISAAGVPDFIANVSYKLIMN